MNEIYSRALVLDRKEIGEADSLVYLFTEEYGKIVARAKSIRKLSSKLSAHFQPLSFVKARFIQRARARDSFILIDGITDDFSILHNTNKRYDLLPILQFINKYSYDLQKDDAVWHFLTGIFSKRYNYKEVAYVLLTILGITGGDDECAICGSHNIGAFHILEEKFICDRCSSKFSPNDILYISKNKMKFHTERN